MVLGRRFPFFSLSLSFLSGLLYSRAPPPRPRPRLTRAANPFSSSSSSSYIILVEHDLSVLDYMSDFVCCLYGKPGAYGVVTMPFSVREGAAQRLRRP